MRVGIARRGWWPVRALRICVSVIVLATLVVAKTALPTHAASCSSVNYTITTTHSPIFYTNLGNSPSINSTYLGYKVTNGTGASKSDIWIKLSGFGSNVTLGNSQQDSLVFDSLANGAADARYFYVTVAALSATSATHTISLYQGRPDLGTSSLLCTQTDTITSVADMIQATSNKVTSASLSPASPTLGSTFQITVNGATGTIGSGPDGLGALIFSPSTYSTWPANSFRFTHSSITIPATDAAVTAGTSTNFEDKLYFTNVGTKDRNYTAVFTFEAIAPTASNSSISPISGMASGSAIKHTTTASLSAIPPISPPSNTLTLAKTSNVNSVNPPSTTVTYTITASNSGTQAVILDDIVDTIPSGSSYVTGTSSGATTNNPDVSGQTLTWTGPFSVPAAVGATPGTTTLSYNLTLSTSVGTYTNSATGHLGTTQIDTTTSTSDNSPATKSVTVNNVAPVAVNDSVSTNEDTAATFTVRSNDYDPNGTTPTIQSVASPSHGTTSISSGSILYTPTANYFGADSFTYTITDGSLTSTATVSVTVVSVNDAPVATNDSRTTSEDTAVTLSNLKTNDTDIENDALTITAVGNPSHGTTSISGGNVIYTPTANYNGSDSFTYTISDGNGGTSTATVTMTISAVNDAPDAVDDSRSTNEDTAVTLSNLKTNDTDIENDALTITAVGNPSHGTTSISGGNVIYTPTTNYNGSDSFTYTISDGALTDTATVTMTIGAVNDAPVATNDGRTTSEDTAVTLADLKSNDTDIDGDSLTITAVGNPSHGTTSISGGNVIYTPTANYNGSDSFTYTISDGIVTSTATVTMVISAVNDAPVATNDSRTTSEDTAVTLTDLKANDTDIENDALTITAVGNPSHGTTSISGGNVIYTPDADYNGSDSFTYTISDGALTDTATVTMTISAVNDAPDAVDDTRSTSEDTDITISDLLANDTDLDGDSLSISSIGTALNGTATLSGDSVTYSPNLNFNGSDTFSYTISDGHGGTDTASVIINVSAVNDAPTAVDDSAGLLKNTSATLTHLTDNDSDVEGSALTIVSVGTASNGTVTLASGDVIYTPDFNFSGTDSFTYTISDGSLTDTATVDITVRDQNFDPVAVDDTATTNEDTAVDIDAIANDSDPDVDTISIDSIGTVSNGTATIVSGQIHYVPDANYFGDDTFTYTIVDIFGATDTATITITVTPVNDAPVAADDTATTTEDSAVTILAADVLANDTDIDLDTLTIDSVTTPTNGAATIDGNGDISYTPDTDFNGTDTFDYTITDGNGGTDTATITITVTPVNDAPVAADDTATTTEDSAVTILAADVLANDTDIDLDTLTIDSVTTPTNGAATIDGNGDISYTPDTDFNGTDTFDYTITDGNGGTDTATITITVTPVNDAPVAADDTATTTEDSAVTILAADVLANDTDIDLDTLTIDSVTTPTNGAATIDGNGDISYTPDTDFNGTDTFDYTITDGNGGTDTATITITVTPVNDAPVAADDTATTTEDSAVTILAADVLANDTDIDLDTLTIDSVTTPTNGAATIDGNGDISYTPDTDFNGTDTFDYTITDGNGGTDTATITITVTPVNDAPVAADDTATTTEDSAVTILAADVLANDTDIDLDTLTIDSVTTPTNGAATIDGNGDISYTPDTDFNGTDTFDYTITDGNGGTDTATITITVTPVNDAPVAADDTATTTEDSAVTILAADVLANDTDIDLDTLTIDSVTTPTNGAATIDGNGDISYTPDTDFNGTDTFDYTITDGNGGTDTATITITVTPVNDAPVAADDTATTTEDSAVTILAADVLANDTDIDLDTLTIDSVTTPTNGAATIDGNGDISYTPDTDFNGTDTFDYTITDGNGGTDTATITITVTPVNDAPVAADDTATTTEDSAVTILAADVLANDTDIDLDTLTIDSVTTPTNGAATIDGNGDISYTPDTDFNGTDTFDYTITDGNGGTDTATITITVTPVNDAPVAADDTATTTEDSAVTILAADVLANDTDIDLDTLTIDSVTTPTNGAATIDGNGDISYTPDTDFNGTDTFDYTITDGNGGTDTATITITVTPVNDAPVAADDTATTTEDSAVTILAADVLANDTDIDLDTLTIDSVTTPTNGAATIDGNGDISYTPDTDFNGTDTFDYTITDGNGGTDTATITITVTPVNDAPVAADDTATTTEDSAVTILAADVLANDTDIDLDTLTIDSVTTPTNGAATIDGNGDISYTPDTDFNGTDTFDYTITDGNGGTDTATITITVTPVNDAPVAADDTATTDNRTSIDISVLANDTDIDGDTLSIDSVGAAGNGTVTINGTDIHYVPNAGFDGNDTFTYDVSDSNGGTDTATVTVTVTPTNVDPVATDDTPSVNEDSTSDIAVLANDTDGDGDALSVTSASGATHGSLEITTSNEVRYTPDANYNGTDTFTYDISDGNGGTDTATVTVTVNPVNDAPVATDDTATTNEDSALTILASDIVTNDTDIDGGALTIDSVTTPTNGTATIDGNGDISYTPDADFNGTDTFDYTITDGNGGTDTATITVTVAPVNDAPVAVDDAETTNEDTPIVITVVTNDTDVDGDTLSVNSASGAAHGTTEVVFGTVRYSPDANFTGTDQFTYVVSDGHSSTDTATVTVTVDPVNDAPIAVNDSETAPEDTPTTFTDLVTNDSDIDGDTLVVTSVGSPSHGTASVVSGDVLYTPSTNYHGSDSFTYTISDGNGGTANAVVNVTVTSTNDPPVAVDDTTTTAEDTAKLVNVLSNDSDVDLDSLSISGTTNGTHGTASISSNKVLYTPDSNYNGTDSITYTVSDGHGGTDTGTLTITISPVNDAPIAVDDTASTNEDTAVTITSTDILSNDIDVDGDAVTITSIGSASHGTASIVSGNVRYTPSANYNGSDSITYSISDGHGGTDSGLISITVVPVNDAPDAVNDTATTNEDTVIRINARANDSDIDGDTLSVSGVGAASNGSITLRSGGNIDYEPDPNFNGTDSFIYTISDGNGGTDTATITVTVVPVNDAPVVVDDTTTIAEDSSVDIDVLLNDSDPDGDTLNIQSVTAPTSGTTSVVTGRIRYAPLSNFNGSATFTYTASDGKGGTRSGNVTVVVTPVNDAPVARNNAVTTDEDTSVIIYKSALLANDSDIEESALTITRYTEPTHGVLTVGAGGNFTYVPDLDYNGADSFRYTISDGDLTDSAVVNITIAPVIDYPVANDDSGTGPGGYIFKIDVLSNDIDPLEESSGGKRLTIKSVSNPKNGTTTIIDGLIRYVPDLNFTGTDTFTYEVVSADGGIRVGKVSITVTRVLTTGSATFVADSNSDGILNPGDSPIAGVRMKFELLRQFEIILRWPVGGTSIRSAATSNDLAPSDRIGLLSSTPLATFYCTTNQQGLCSNKSLVPGVYRVSPEYNAEENNMAPSIDPDASKDLTSNVRITATAGGQATFGVREVSSVVGWVMADKDNSGDISTVDQPLSNAEVNIFWFGPDGILGTADDVEYKAETNDEGYYELPDLPRGRYEIRVNPLSVPRSVVIPKALNFNVENKGDTETNVLVGLANGSVLPITGSSSGSTLRIVVNVLLLGLVLVIGSRRRRSA